MNGTGERQEEMMPSLMSGERKNTAVYMSRRENHERTREGDVEVDKRVLFWRRRLSITSLIVLTHTHLHVKSISRLGHYFLVGNMSEEHF